MEVFKICRDEYSKSLKASGVANRWNVRGQYVIYTGSYRSLSTLEMVVHRGAIMPSEKYVVMVISLPDDATIITPVHPDYLPENWRTLAAYSALQEIGSKWYSTQKSLALKVPSAVIPYENNYILNTEHPDFSKTVQLIRTEDYFWDRRLF